MWSIFEPLFWYSIKNFKTCLHFLIKIFVSHSLIIHTIYEWQGPSVPFPFMILHPDWQLGKALNGSVSVNLIWNQTFLARLRNLSSSVLVLSNWPSFSFNCKVAYSGLVVGCSPSNYCNVCGQLWLTEHPPTNTSGQLNLQSWNAILPWSIVVVFWKVERMSLLFLLHLILVILNVCNMSLAAMMMMMVMMIIIIILWSSMCATWVWQLTQSSWPNERNARE